MPRQITTASAGLSVPVLEHRIAVLERRVALLTDAIRTLAAALEGNPLDPPDGGGTTRAAREAHELLLLGD
ncbi:MULTISPECIES: hypothetical protein [unclassified Spirillospora]|uniref:hypothetical protein n=1 Tax=unclassified Spirillospora TaxID=2642701 RepID=UPI00371085C3